LSKCLDSHYLGRIFQELTRWDVEVDCGTCKRQLVLNTWTNVQLEKQEKCAGYNWFKERHMCWEQALTDMTETQFPGQNLRNKMCWLTCWQEQKRRLRCHAVNLLWGHRGGRQANGKKREASRYDDWRGEGERKTFVEQQWMISNKWNQWMQW
jgi:hypothetical protein